MIRFRNIHFSYRHAEPVLVGVNLDIGRGVSLLLGPNGCGKSTLLKMAAGVELPDHGTTEIAGYDLWKNEVLARQNLAYVPEQPDLTPYATIRDVTYLVCRLRKIPLDEGREVLKRVELWDVSSRSIRELSMGQRRRVVLAAAWIGSPRVILLDEPLEAMDRSIREEILAWIDRLLDNGASILIATHEIEPFLMKASRAITVRSGQCRAFEHLPDNPEKRMEFLEGLSRGRA